MRMVETPQSSQIESAGHENGVLYVLFRYGALYTYYGVPKHLFIDLVNDSSTKGCLNKHIEKRYPYERLY